MNIDVAGLLRRVGCSAAAGVVFCAAWLGLVSLTASGFVCNGSLGCVLWAVILLPAALVVAMALVWPALVLLRVKWSWLVALIGPVVSVAFAQSFTRLDVQLGSGGGAITGFGEVLGVTALGYALAAVVSAPDLRPGVRWGMAVPLGLVVAGCFAIGRMGGVG